MTDRRPECVYGILVRDAHVFLVRQDQGLGLPGGVFPEDGGGPQS